MAANQNHESSDQPPLQPQQQHDDDDEDVLLIPPKLTQSAYRILQDANAIPRPWHLEGRFGSRTSCAHVDNEKQKRMSIPVSSHQRVTSQAKQHAALQELLATPGVSLGRARIFIPSRVRAPPVVDSTMHPERQRRRRCCDDIDNKDDKTPLLWNRNLPQAPPLSPPSQKHPPQFTYVELFAGIGGFGIALDALGGQCVLASELLESCRETYSNNIDCPNLCGDIYDIPNTAIPPHDLLVAGFPCQPFSAAGTQPGLECDKGRGVLFLQIVRMLQQATPQPQAFLLENVPGLLTMKETLTTIVTALEQTGYQVSYQVCTARGLTATGRKRLFLVGLRQDISSGGDKDFCFPYIPDLKIRAQDVLDYDDETQDGDILELSETTFDQLTTGGRWRPAHLAWPNLVCTPLTSHYGNSVGRGDSQLVPTSITNTTTTNTSQRRPRRFSIRECARLMGFPNTYQFRTQPKPGQGIMAHLKEHYRMIGNAVCPPLIAVLAGAVLDRIDWNQGVLQQQQQRQQKIMSSSGSNDQNTSTTKPFDDYHWLQKGHDTAVVLARAALRPIPVALPRSCCVPTTDESP